MFWNMIWAGTTHNRAVAYTPDELRLIAAYLEQCDHDGSTPRMFADDHERMCPWLNRLHFYRIR